MSDDINTETRSLEVDGSVEVRNLIAREIDVLLMPWGATIQTSEGLETFERGAFDGTNPNDVRLQGLEHEIHLGMGQNGQPRTTRHPVGKAIALSDRDDGQHATFRVAKTSRGDEVLALAEDGIASGVSVEFSEVPGGSVTETRSGRRTRVHRRVRLTGASTTYRPAYQGAVVLAVRSEGEPVTDPVADVAPVPAPVPVAAPAIDISPVTLALEKMAGSFDAMSDKLAQAQERSRADFHIPSADEQAQDAKAKTGVWVQTVIQMLSGDRISERDLQTRALDDLITSENLGVIPTPVLEGALIGVIDASRPFLNSTKKFPLPSAGMTLRIPKIVTRPETGVQAAEKDELASNSTSITSVSVDPITIGGAGDLSIQLLKRSSPEFLALYIELLAESYARNAEIEGIQALLASSPSSGGALDVEDANFGAAWVNGAAVRKTPDTIWMSAEAVAKFINAKADGTNAPLYSTIQSGFTAGSGPAGTISGLRPVYLPDLDVASATVDVIIGPSSGFGWTEDGTYTLQVDVPAKAGRDVAIVGMLWYATMYPTAFTTYTIAS